jgi:5-methylcytosine-specific restriction endonuclease McrA
MLFADYARLCHFQLKKHSEVCREMKLPTRLLAKSTGRRKSHFTDSRALTELYGNSCFQCKQPLALTDVTLDHIVARANGGEAVAANLQVLCLKCNQAKKNGEVAK